jgi:uncharacterized protein (TIGR02391 family)
MSGDDLEIRKEFNDGSLAVKCGFCDGSGQFPDTDFDGDDLSPFPCSACNGKGFNVFATSKDNLVPCGLCEGTGKGWSEDGYFTGETCTVCRGTGVIQLDKKQIRGESFWSLLHPRITSVARARFRSRHYADAVEAALKEINTTLKQIVRDQTGQDLDGVAAVQRAFSLQNPIIRLADLSTETGRNIQKGYLQIFSGSIVGIRNPKAHENISINRTEAIHYLFLGSLLMSKIVDR